MYYLIVLEIDGKPYKCNVEQERTRPRVGDWCVLSSQPAADKYTVGKVLSVVEKSGFVVPDECWSIAYKVNATDRPSVLKNEHGTAITFGTENKFTLLGNSGGWWVSKQLTDSEIASQLQAKFVVNFFKRAEVDING